MSPLDPSPIVPFRAGELPRRSWRDNLAAVAAEGAISLALNLAVMAALVHLAFPRVLDKSEPQTITVDLVPEGPRGAAGARDGHASGTEADAAPKTTGESQKAEPKPVEATPPPPPPEASASAKKPEVSADPPVQPAEPPKPASPDAKPPTLAEPAPKPPGIDRGRDEAPRLVAAPEAPTPAATQADRNVAANAETKPAASPHPTEQPPVPAPETLAAPAGSPDTVPQPSSAGETSHPAAMPSAEEKREAENTAKLAEALPFAQNLPPTFARTAIPGLGDATVQKYRGAVYGQFHKADDLVDRARSAHLRGQTVVEFSIDDTGALTGLRVAVSSGQPEVDRIAEDIIRRAAPFPPPPPGAQHVFSPAIRLGLDE